jgi:hypothetical protein
MAAMLIAVSVTHVDELTGVEAERVGSCDEPIHGFTWRVGLSRKNPQIRAVRTRHQRE